MRNSVSCPCPGLSIVNQLHAWLARPLYVMISVARMFLVWVKFLICASIVMVSGTKLSKYGDAIAEKTGLTRAWVGLLLLAAITSMPELVTGVSAVAKVGIPDLAIGIILGIDRLLDMCRTTVNVWGDAVGAKIITRIAPDDEHAQPG